MSPTGTKVTEKGVLLNNRDFLVFLSLMTTSFLSMSVSNTFLASIAVENNINPIQVCIRVNRIYLYIFNIDVDVRTFMLYKIYVKQ